MGSDGLLRIDRLVSDRHGYVLVPGDYLGDVRGQAVEDGVGDEDSTEVVRGVVQRGAVGLVDQAGAGQGIVQQCADTLAGDALRFGGDAALEQQRGWRHPDVFVVVPGADQRDSAANVADPADDRAEHVGQFGADHHQPFGVGFGRGDLQQGDDLPGGRQPVLDQTVVAQLQHLLGADTGVPQNLDDGPGPEGVVFLAVEQSPLSGGQVLGPDVVRVRVRAVEPNQGLVGGAELLTRAGQPPGGEQGC